MKPGDRMYTPDERRQIMDALEASGQSAYAFAKQAGVHATTLYRWSRGIQKTQRERWQERTAARRAEYFALRAEGLSRHKACMVMGLNHDSAKRWEAEREATL